MVKAVTNDNGRTVVNAGTYVIAEADGPAALRSLRLDLHRWHP